MNTNVFTAICWGLAGIFTLGYTAFGILSIGYLGLSVGLLQLVTALNYIERESKEKYRG